MNILRADLDYVLPLLTVCNTLAPTICLHTMTRRRQHHTGTFFGSRVEPEFPASPAGEAILRQFRRHIWIWAVCIAVGCVFFESVPAGVPLFLMGSLMMFVGMFGSIFAGLIAFSMAHKRTREEAVAPPEPTVRMASLAESEPNSPWLRVVGGLMMILPLLLPMTTLLITTHYWSQLSSHDASQALQSIGYAVVIGSLCSATQWALLFRTRSGDWATTTRASYRYRTYFGVMQGIMFILINWNMCALALARLHSAVPWLHIASRSAESRAYLYVFLAMAAFVCGLQFWMSKQTDRQNSDSMADRYWKAGHFYNNPDDPVLVVPSRTGVGFSLNFGSTAVRLVAASYFVFLIATTVNLIRVVFSN